MSSSGWCRRCGRPGSDSTPPPSARCRPQRRPPGGRAAPRAAAGRVAGVLDAISRPRLPDERGLLLVSYKLGDRVGARAGAGAAAGRRPGAEAGGAGRGGSGDRGGGGGRTRGAVRAGGAGGGAGPGGRLPGGGVRGPTGCWPSIPRCPQLSTTVDPAAACVAAGHRLAAAADVAADAAGIAQPEVFSYADDLETVSVQVPGLVVEATRCWPGCWRGSPRWTRCARDMLEHLLDGMRGCLRVYREESASQAIEHLSDTDERTDADGGDDAVIGAKVADGFVAAVRQRAQQDRPGWPEPAGTPSRACTRRRPRGHDRVGAGPAGWRATTGWASMRRAVGGWAVGGGRRRTVGWLSRASPPAGWVTPASRAGRGVGVRARRWPRRRRGSARAARRRRTSG